MDTFLDAHIENDKTNAPFLLAASFNSHVEFVGSHAEKGVLYWHFTPKEKALELLDQFQTKKEPRIPAKDLFEAIEAFWKILHRELLLPNRFTTEHEFIKNLGGFLLWYNHERGHGGLKYITPHAKLTAVLKLLPNY